MPTPARRTGGALLATVLAIAAPVLASPTPASAEDLAPSYSISVGALGSWTHPTDTPAAPYIDKDGTFWYQQSAALYGSTDPRYWDFFSGTDLDTATRNATVSNYVNPANANDKNNDTTWRCNNSPTGLEATAATGSASYAHRNYCDLAGVWVDPDTGDWYGLVHNEFTPQPFGDGLHYDAIDYAVSTDQGKTWKIKDHVITSPFSTTRGDTTGFPNQTYSYGDGDQRLLVDTVSGYFYVFYGSRIVDKSGGWKAFYEHVARAPISGKMAPNTWQKWYDGSWSQPGKGGKESNMVPVGGTNTTGYTPVAGEYDPANTGTSAQQIAAGKMPATSPLFVMDVTWNAYLGLYIGQPQAVDQSGNAPQEIYATADLATQKWFKLGDTGSYHTASWYRWFLDGANRTSSAIVGKDFRTYCSFGCSGGRSGEYVNLSVGGSTPAAAPVDLSKTYKIANGGGRVLAQVSGGSTTTSVATGTGAALEGWNFQAVGDGSYRIANASTGQLLGVDATANSGRAWGAKPTVTAAAGGTAAVGQQWWVLANTSAPGTFRIVNRYSGLAIGLSATSGRLAETTPGRTWTDASGSAVGNGRTSAEQTLTLTATGTAPESVVLNSPGNQSSTVNSAVSLQLSATDSLQKPLTFTATGLPAGLTISASGLISGTPTAGGSSSVTVTASSGTASSQTTFGWTVNPLFTGAHTLSTGGKALDDPDHSTTAGTQMITWTLGTGSNQQWTFARQSDGSYTLTNGKSNMCLDVSDSSTTAGGKIIQWTCTTGSANQRWNVNRLANGSYTVRSVHSGLLLTTASTANGALVTQQPDTGSALQQWTIS
ncbi:RICIN domain-containing protein [Kitasatospora sp. NPDC096147]|uniref:RICIN domain-containing protein n=1 Tax=Kitasatospora sp. NPDC096147 TaxID=3364093 RepID=UPI0038032172